MDIQFSDPMEGSLTWTLPVQIAEAIARLPQEDRTLLREKLTAAMQAQASLLIAAILLDDMNEGLDLVYHSGHKLAEAIQMMGD